ncbi:hypothetical protein HPB47_018653 [Ixodes persulcatus]|uniref:Uncharacterized protein n=1 Tax=Ixodes persulcatus TaxID=34615 RepID=A0AC60R2X3_IXOPE|nr:hypothetical protein HPB47_018653 [Ixodes persulcatus]
MVDYRGLRRVRRRCGQEIHIGHACKTPRCGRCGVFGHPTAGLTAPCLSIGHAHATTDSTQPKTYSEATPLPHDPSRLPLEPSPERRAAMPEIVEMRSLRTTEA